MAASTLIHDSLLEHAMAEAGRILRAAAPLDLIGQAIYLVPSAWHWVLQSDFAYAWTAADLDLEMKPYLEAWRMWRGRGFATIFNSDFVRSRDARLIRRKVLATTLHEAAHWLCAKAGHFEPYPGKFEGSVLAVLEADHTAVVPPWYQHGLPFIRAALHLQYRAGKQGEDIGLNELQVAGRFYGLSSIFDYAVALGGEAAQLRDVAIIELLKTRPPRDLQSLFEADTCGWRPPG